MNINTDSWHYRITAIFWFSVKERDHTSLCVYFWKFIFAFLFLGMGVLIQLNIVAFSIVKLLNFEPMLSFFYEYNLNIPARVFLNLQVGIVVMLVFSFSLFWLLDLYQNNRKAKKKSSFILQYFKSVKNKICPIINYTNKKEVEQ